MITLLTCFCTILLGMIKILKAGMSTMASMISKNWTFDTGENLFQMVFKKLVVIQ